MASIPPTEKFAELVLYIAWKTEHEPRFGATKLNKVLFFADFEHYRRTGMPITHARYIKKQHGPVPSAIEATKRRLCADDRALEREEMAGSFVSRRFIPVKQPNLDLFTAREIALVDFFIEQVARETAQSVSDRTHELDGWKLATMGEEIPYFTALLPDEEDSDLTDEELRRGAAVAARLDSVP